MNKKILSCLFLCIIGLSMIHADALAQYNQGRAHQFRDSWYSAIESYQEAVRINPAYTDAWKGMAECFYALGEYSQALTHTDRALFLKNNDPALLNLKGFILIGLEKIAEARDLFTFILTRWPNDVESRYGLAELDVLDGRIGAAQEQYVQALQRSPENRKALVSLAIISREAGNERSSRDYIQRALRSWGDDPSVFYFAGYLAARNGSHDEAERHLVKALSLNPGHDDSLYLLSVILYRTQRFAEVVTICDTRIAADRRSAGAWYLKTLALDRQGLYEQALRTARSGLEVRASDELLRAFYENLIMIHLPFEDNARKPPSLWHADRAARFEQQNMSDQAVFEYRRALKINPYGIQERTSYARLLLNQGFPSRHLEQLSFIQTLGEGNRDIRDAIETWNKMLASSIHRTWKIDPLYLDKAHTSIGFYWMPDTSNLLHPDAERITAAMLAEHLSYNPRYKTNSTDTYVASYSEAFRQSRLKGEDYFVLVSFSGSDREVRIVADVYVSRTGSRAASWTSFRTGNDAFALALRKMSQTIATSFPVQGRLIARFQNDGVINLGKADGLAKDAVFDLVPVSALVRSDEGIGLGFAADQVLGTCTVTGTDEEVSQVRIARNGIFDRINTGDAVVLRLKDDAVESVAQEPVRQRFPQLLELLRSVR